MAAPRCCLGSHGRRQGFAPESLASIWIGSRQLGGDLQRDLALEAGVPGAVDLAHAAGAKERRDLVGTETNPGVERHGADCAGSIS